MYVSVRLRGLDRGLAQTDSFGFLTANCWSLVKSSWRRSGGKTESRMDMALVVMVLARPSMVLTMPDMASRGES